MKVVLMGKGYDKSDEGDQKSLAAGDTFAK
jgi:hypothetical protein